MANLEQAAYLELAFRALEKGDRAALVGALASLDTATLDHLAAVLEHPVWCHLRVSLPDLPALLCGLVSPAGPPTEPQVDGGGPARRPEFRGARHPRSERFSQPLSSDRAALTPR